MLRGGGDDNGVVDTKEHVGATSNAAISMMRIFILFVIISEEGRLEGNNKEKEHYNTI